MRRRAGDAGGPRVAWSQRVLQQRRETSSAQRLRGEDHPGVPTQVRRARLDGDELHGEWRGSHDHAAEGGVVVNDSCTRTHATEQIKPPQATGNFGSPETRADATRRRTRIDGAPAKHQNLMQVLLGAGLSRRRTCSSSCRSASTRIARTPQRPSFAWVTTRRGTGRRLIRS